MTTWSPLAAALALPAVALVAAAAPVPKVAVTPISAANAAEVRSLSEHDKRAQNLTRVPGTNELLILDWNAAAEVVDDVKFRSARVLTRGKKPTDLAISPDGKFVTWTERNKETYTVQEAATGKSFDIKVGGAPGGAAFSPDSKLLALGYTFWDPAAEGAGYSEMRLYDLKGQLVRTLARSGAGALKPVFSPDGKTLAVGNRNYETSLFDVATGKFLHVLDKAMTQEVAFRPDGKVLAAGYVDGSVGVWDVASGKKLGMEATGCKEVYSVDWSPKGDVLVTSGLRGKIVLWEPQQLTKIKELNAPDWVIQVRFTADGTRLLSSSSSEPTAKADRKIEVWGLPGNR